MKQYFMIYLLTVFFFNAILYFVLKSMTIIPEPFFTLFFVFKALVGLCVSGFVFLLLLRYYQLRVKTLFYLIGMLVSFLIYDLFNALSFFIFNSDVLDHTSLAKFLAIFGNLFFLFIVGWLILFISYYSNKVINPFILLPVAFALGIYIANIFDRDMITIWHFIINNQPLYYYVNNPNELDYYAIMSLNFSYFGIYSFLQVLKARQRTKDPLLRLEQELFIVCVSFTSIFAPIILLPPIYVVKDAYIYFIILFFLLTSIAMLVFVIIILPFILTKKRAYLQPPVLHWFIISRIGGNPLFYYHFSQEHEMKNELEVSTFLSGVITAVDTIMQTHVEVDTPVQSMIFSDKILLIRINEGLRFILVTEFETSFVLKSLEIIANEVPKVFKNEIITSLKTGETLLNNGDITEFVREKLGF